jgi:hypothetical protein
MSGCSNKMNVHLRIKCIELYRTQKGICVAYGKKRFWLPLGLIKLVEEDEDGFTKISLPRWLFLAKMEACKRQEETAYS